MLTERIDFTSHGIKKRRQNKKLGLEKTMTAEIKRKWGETMVTVRQNLAG